MQEFRHAFPHINGFLGEPADLHLADLLSFRRQSFVNLPG